MSSCQIAPSIGVLNFKLYKLNFGYESAWKLHFLSISPLFQLKYADILQYNEDGSPTLESLSYCPEFNLLIKKDEKAGLLNSAFEEYGISDENYNYQMNLAFVFNSQNPNNKDFVANVVRENGKVKVLVLKKNELALLLFKRLYKDNYYKNHLFDIVLNLGITQELIDDIFRDNTISNVVELLIKLGSGDYNIGNNALSLILESNGDNRLIKRGLELNKDYKYKYDALATDIINFLNSGDLSNIVIPRLSLNIEPLFLQIDVLALKEMLENAVFHGSNAYLNMSELALVNKDEIAKKEERQIIHFLIDTIELKNDLILKILENAGLSEMRRRKIKSEKADVDKNYYVEDDMILGMHKYARVALKTMHELNDNLSQLDEKTDQEKFRTIRDAYMMLSSYKLFSDSVNRLLVEEETQSEDLRFVNEARISYDDETEEELSETIKDLVDGMNNISEYLKNKIDIIAVPMFCKFIEPFFGDCTVDRDGNKRTIEEIVGETNGDISWIDYWLDSMANTADTLSLAFDIAVKLSKGEAKQNTIKDIEDILELQNFASQHGIYDFEFMFEKDKLGRKTGFYVTKTDWGAFKQAYREMLALAKKIIDPNEKASFISNWKNEYCESQYSSKPKAGHPMWASRTYNALSSELKEFLERFLELKQKYDSRYDHKYILRNKAILIRRDTFQRTKDLLNNFSALNAYEYLKESVREDLTVDNDNANEFGLVEASGKIDFEGRVIQELPILYVNEIRNLNELSTDVISTLQRYAFATNNFEAMNKVVDVLEVGRTIFKERKINKMVDDKNVVEILRGKNAKELINMYDIGGNLAKKIDDFFDSKVYGMYMHDNGSFKLPIFHKRVNTNKFASFFQRMSSTAMMGFNWLANLASINTGIAMVNIESASGLYFDMKTLFNADKEYAKMMPLNLLNLGKLYKNDKLSLFDLLFDIRLNFDTTMREAKRDNILSKIFGESFAYLGLDGGDHWLYNRVAIAYCMYKKVKLKDGSDSTLWDALEIVDAKKGNTTIKRMQIKEGTYIEENGKKKLINVNDISHQIMHINQNLFGIYNTEDSVAAKRTISGRLLMMYRDWVKPQLNYRILKELVSLVMGNKEEGYYRTLAYFLYNVGQDLRKGSFKIMLHWDELTAEHKANIKKALFELALFTAVLVLARRFDDDDKDDTFLDKFAHMVLEREFHELAFLTPTPYLPHELMKTVKSPTPLISVIDNLSNVLISLSNPEDWSNELLSGPFKGMSTLEKNLLKSPLPGISYYYHIKKMIDEDDIDLAIRYYKRSN